MTAPGATRDGDRSGAIAAPGRFWLSVLVPMFKVEAYLDQCLGSVMAQADAGVIVQPEVWKFGFGIVSHSGIPT